MKAPGHGNHSDHSSHSHSGDVEVKSVDRLSKTQVRLTIAFTGESVQRHERMTAERYSRAAKIPGFRPGKAPMKLVFDRYREDIHKEIISHLLEAGLAEAFDKTKLEPVNRPRVKFENLKIETGKPFEFQAEFEVQPEIEVNKYKGVPLKKSSLEISEDEVTSTLDSLRERMGTLEPSDQTKPEAGAFVVVEVGYQLKDDATKTEAPKPFTVEVGRGKLIPDIDTAILEMAVGDTKQVTSAFPDDYNEKNLAGQIAVFDLKLVEIKRRTLPALDDAFAETLRPGGTVETLRKEIRESLTASKREEEDKSRRQQIVDYLVRQNQFEVPNSLIDRQSQSLLSSMLEDMKKRGQANPDFRDEDVRLVRKSAEEIVRSSLILREIALKEKIELDQTKLQAKIEAIAAQLKRTPEETEKFLSGRGMMDRIREEVLTDQVFDFIVQNAEAVSPS